METIVYRINCPSSHQKLLHFEASFPATQEQVHLHISAWRPGRYELANFAKNIKNFTVFDDQMKPCTYRKINKDTWEVDTSKTTKITIRYAYYSAELNAGSTFIDDTQIYINPVNCIIYSEEAKDLPFELNIEAPQNWIKMSSMLEEDGVFRALNFDELADSPLLISKNLQSASYNIEDTDFTIWVNNHKPIDWTKIIEDFSKFTKAQIETFGEFPSKTFEFLIHCLPYTAYHGVEHLKSTVITLGPTPNVLGDQYNDLLGIASHELYHVYNVKSIRPIEMLPYDFKQENYSSLGYVYEGITTYMGDLFLLKSGVFTLKDYLKELSEQLQKHFDNPGRFSYSVAESSFDTWLDGYVPGVPGRKVSIYTEGCLLAFCADIMIRKASNNKANLDEVMKRLYYDFALKNIGITEKDYRNELENISGTSFKDFFEHYINGTHSLEGILVDSLDYLGLEIKQTPSKLYAEGRLGIKTVRKNDKEIISAIFPGSPGDIGGLAIHDEIISVNKTPINNNLDLWLKYFEDDIKSFEIFREGKSIEKSLPEVNRYFYQTHEIEVKKSLIPSQQKAIAAWALEGVKE